MKRVSVELRHREVTITTEGSALHDVRSQPDHESAVTVCPTCGKSRTPNAAWTEGEVPAAMEFVQRVLEKSVLHQQDAIATKHPEITGAAPPDSGAT